MSKFILSARHSDSDFTYRSWKPRGLWLFRMPTTSPRGCSSSMFDIEAVSTCDQVVPFECIEIVIFRTCKVPLLNCNIRVMLRIMFSSCVNNKLPYLKYNHTLLVQIHCDNWSNEDERCNVNDFFWCKYTSFLGFQCGTHWPLHSPDPCPI